MTQSANEKDWKEIAEYEHARANMLAAERDAARSDLSLAVEALKELTQIVECSDWTNPDMPTWEFEAQLEEAKRHARKVYEQITKG